MEVNSTISQGITTMGLFPLHALGFEWENSKPPAKELMIFYNDEMKVFPDVSPKRVSIFFMFDPILSSISETEGLKTIKTCQIPNLLTNSLFLQ